VADRCVAWAVAAVVVAFLAGCASQVAAPPGLEKRGPANFPDAYYQRRLEQGAPVFRVDPEHSLVVIEVRRAGSLAKLGHDHVVASHDIAGYIAPDEGRADVYVPLDALAVDEPTRRAEAGFDTQPSPADIAGTRSNMLNKVLDTARYPYAVITVNDRAAGGAQQLPVAITLHGTIRSVDAAIQIENYADEVSVTGAVALDQSQFGMVPFSLLGGAIAVQDRLNITFKIRARRMK
jgi:polyisoprenoid-binding protein YceI